MKALSIRQPYAELIMRGDKKIEYRSRNTNVRERVYIYASLTPADTEEFEDIGLKPGDLPTGVIIGTVEIVGCNEEKGYFDSYEWHLANPERLEKPVKPDNHPQPVWFTPFNEQEKNEIPQSVSVGVTMDILSLQTRIMDEYKSYISSFVNISHDRIKNKVEEEILKGKLWPEPLIQFNPSYEYAESTDDLCNQGLLNPDLINIFSGYKLYKHQVEAIKLGVSGKDFIVTSGTGSGKSLTYLATIFNHILNQQKKDKGIKAVIVYPMNALINSQREEIDGYRDKYKAVTGNDFPISYAQYTGQEKEDQRELIRKNLPDIILTNYMMLELLLTRRAEFNLRQSIFECLQFLVFDELHTYRGRQGSDVALLIRRIKSNARNRIICIGTSATMVSGGGLEEQKKKVAEVASLIFGTRFTSDLIIDETIVTSIKVDELGKDSVRKIINDRIDEGGSEDQLKVNPLAAWLEREVALSVNDGKIIRNKPKSLSEIVDQLHEYSGFDASQCNDRIVELLMWISVVNSRKENQRDAYLPFRLHQFISQTGSVYVTLDQGDGQVITLDPGICVGDNTTGKPLYPVVFSRISGHPFICVLKNNEEGTLVPRDFEDTGDDEEEETVQTDAGYLIIGDDFWNPEEDIHMLPDAWVKVDKTGTARIQKDYQNRLPSRLYFDENGNFSDKTPMKYQGWFMPYRLLFDPTSGTFFETKTSERTKLARLGNEGRSTATTVLSFLILKNLNEYKFSDKDQKLLSFTDNRQDAALQAGHFNDFIEVVQLRAAIYRALLKSPSHSIDHTEIAQKIFDELGIDQKDYAAKPSTTAFMERENQSAIKDFIMYRVLYDLRRSWRVILPNLEQCGLLVIGYKNLGQICEETDFWKDVPLLNHVTVEKRTEIVYQLLDFIRKSYAIYSSEYLTKEASDRKRKSIQEKLVDPWKFDEDEKINEPNYVTYDSLKGSKNIFTQSVGSRSSFGRYIKSIAKELGDKLNDESYYKTIQAIFRALCDAGWLKSAKAYTSSGDETVIFQLGIDMIEWKLGDSVSIVPDYIKLRSYKRDQQTWKPNRFFQELYTYDFASFKKKLHAEDHTGQLTNTDRIDREDKFREGSISALFCSPTMELGVNISTLNVVHMRNVPPNPANYAQRGGRAGRSGQSALIFTFCSSFAPHDRHYFRESKEMVSGVVAPPQIDLTNEELLSTHLHSIYLSVLNRHDIDRSIRDLLSNDDPSLPLKKDVRANLTPSAADKTEIRNAFTRVVDDFKEKLLDKRWFTRGWIDQKIDSVIDDLDRTLNRWRKLYTAAQVQLENAHSIKKSGTYANNSPEMKAAIIDDFQARRQIILLCNQDESGSLSEFYPFRYLASEGFLPGYNFTRLPLRAYIPRGDSGDYVSRPRNIAIREFGPRNVIYYNGSKYQINQLMLQEALKNLKTTKICVSSGYCLMDEELNYEVCPLTGEKLEGKNRDIITDILEMTESRTIPRDRISCEEEERLSQGYKLDIYFSVPGGLDRIIEAKVKSDREDYLNIRYIPAARLVHVNKGWWNSEETGFPMGMISGLWKKSISGDPNKEQENRVKLYTTDTADALYIEPIAALALSWEGVITLQYALKRGIENMFQVEPNEIAVTLMGDEDHPNIFLYEAAQGSLGILSQFVEDPQKFVNLAREAHKICRFDEPGYREPASYDDLLSYYNQRHHHSIDRWQIKDALEKLMICDLEVQRSRHFNSYDEQYAFLREHYDHNSSTELKFLDYLYGNGVRLPDDAQREVDGIYVKPDFYYNPDIWVFCDGTPHDDPKQKKHDDEVRQAIRNRGEQVIEYYYKDNLDDLVSRRPDIFKKVR